MTPTRHAFPIIAPFMAKKAKQSSPGGRPPRVAVITSSYNATVTDALREGAVREYVSRGGRSSDLTLVSAPGAFELPAISHAAAQTGRFAGIVALGCIIRGETSHDRYIAQAVANGITQSTLETGVPIAFGVLTTDTPEQALARAGGDKGNKGCEAMAALLETIDAVASLRARRPQSKGPARPDKARRRA